MAVACQEFLYVRQFEQRGSCVQSQGLGHINGDCGPLSILKK
jgi:hypothetical protein